MVAISFTLANVGIGNNSSLESVQVGEAVSQGMPGYLNPGDGLYMKASKASLLQSRADVIFLTAAPINGWAVVARGDGKLIKLGGLTAGKTYAVGAAGAIIPIEDLTTGDWKTLIGEATTTDYLKTKFNVTEIQLP